MEVLHEVHVADVEVLHWVDHWQLTRRVGLHQSQQLLGGHACGLAGRIVSGGRNSSGFYTVFVFPCRKLVSLQITSLQFLMFASQENTSLQLLFMCYTLLTITCTVPPLLTDPQITEIYIPVPGYQCLTNDTTV